MKEDRFQKNTMVKAQGILQKEIKRRLPETLQALADLEAGRDAAAAAEILFKFAHTLKGSGQMVGWREIADPAVALETALRLIREYGVTVEQGTKCFLKAQLSAIEEAVFRFCQETADCSPECSSGCSPELPECPREGAQILVVDDDAAITALIEENLKKTGFSVTVCHDTQAAEEVLRATKPDLILLDIIFPTDDGIAFCRKLRSSDAWGRIPVIFLSVKDKLQDKLAGFSSGADDYLCKPFRMEELVVRIDAVLKRINSNRDLILRDELTRIYNRRHLQTCLSEEISQAQRGHTNFSVGMVDLDRFKEINDRYGHIAGDQVLRWIVTTMTHNLRDSDVVCRYGGDEFVIVMPQLAKPEGARVIERLRRIIAEQPVKLETDQLEIGVTISAGVAGFPDDGITGAEVLNSADQALYIAKKGGRNRVSLQLQKEEI